MRRTIDSFLIAACASFAASCTPSVEEAASRDARFDWFVYEGRDAAFEGALAPGDYRNPILAGFYPDPSVTQLGGDYYLVNSTFAYFPGIPVFHSRDLVSWTQIGNVIDRPGMLDFSGLGLSRGVFAPTIEHHQGVFYVANTCVDCGGNFIVTTEDPAGPWSDPVWLPEVGGIDPSLFFDEDGRVYLLNNDAPPAEPLYPGHRAIWIREIHPQTFQSISEPVVLIDGGVRPEEKPIWIEGPHIYKANGRYYLSAAEGGTAVNHSQVVLRSDTVLGPYEPFEGNPILTQRDLPEDRANPVTSVGHADYVTDAEGNWWATFLGVRPYEGDHYNTGRETFLLPVEWRDGWPVILDRGGAVPYCAARPALPPAAAPDVPSTENFRIREEFDAPLDPYWLFVRVPEEPWWRVEGGALAITPRTERLGDGTQPSLIARRQQHQTATAETALRFSPGEEGDEAGLAVLQSDDFYYALGLGRDDAGDTVLRLRRRAGSDAPPRGETIASQQVALKPGEPIRLRIDARGGSYDFAYAIGEGRWITLVEGADGKILSTRTAGGFVGATFAMYAESGG